MKIEKKDFIFLPLGGSSEIGMNSNLYHYEDNWIMVDLGISFADETMPGVDILLPDIDFIVQRRDKLKGIFLTHGHEDHMGAIQYIWDKLRVPIYGSAFTIALLKKKLKDIGLLNNVELIILNENKEINLGPFKIKPISITHSIPDPLSLSITTESGTVFHTGDWKFDNNPKVGNKTNLDNLKSIGDKGVLAIVGDSTNSFVEGKTKSENDAYEGLKSVIKSSNGRIVITCFASNVARIKSIIEASIENNKKVFIAGRSLNRAIEAANEVGYRVEGIEKSFKNLENFSHDNAVIIAGGSQGETRSTMTRIAKSQHEQIKLKPGDTAIFSSSKIPGNELAIERVHNALLKNGIKIITDEDELVHVSGHPGKDDIVKLYNLIKPQISIPVHGTSRHLREHCEIAENCGVSLSIQPENGSLIKLSGNSPSIIYQIPTKSSVPDGNQIIKSDSSIFSIRRRLLWNGSISVVLAFDFDLDLHLPIKLSHNGITEGKSELEWVSEVRDDIEETVYSLSKNQLTDDKIIEDKVRSSIRSVTKLFFNIKPLIDVHIIRGL